MGWRLNDEDARRQPAMGAWYTERRNSDSCVRPPTGCEATPTGWGAGRDSGALTRVHGAETGEKRLWRLRLKTATQVQMTWRVGPQLAKIEDVGQIRPR